MGSVQSTPDRKNPIRSIERRHIKTRKEFRQLFNMEPEVIERIRKDMTENGYDPSFPVLLAMVPGLDPFLLDGHMRMESAGLAGIDLIPFESKPFSSLEEALDYAIHIQRDRRNLSDAEIYKQILLIDKVRPRGQGGQDGTKGKSAAITAAKIGTSTRKVESVRQIQKTASPQQIQAIKSGERTINSILTEVKQNKPCPHTESPDFEHLAVRVMMLTTELFPILEMLTDKQSEDWENALVNLIYQNRKRFRVRP